MTTALWARCAVCATRLNPRTVPVRIDGNYVCVNCQQMAHLLDGAVARELAERDAMEG